ncbi:MAG TPA: glutamate carboxypeptidase [Polyangiaceae bacterium]|nr:glutamate carboxypeptidase [Polyangiaceae bacterium]
MQRSRRALIDVVALVTLGCHGVEPKNERSGVATSVSSPFAPAASVSVAPSASVAPSVPAPSASVTPWPLDDAALALARAHRAAYVRDLTTLVNTDSGTDDAEGLARVAAFAERRLRELGAEVEVRPAPPSAGKLVRATFRGTGTRKLLLLAHLDTVFGKGEAARRPFRIEGDRAFGPGVADDKGGVVLVLHALALLRERHFRGYGVLSVIFDPDEEKGSPGSRELIRTLAAEQDAVLSFEPPDAERVIVATNGIALLELAVKGRASHAGSAPEQGRNAALELAHQIVRLKDLGDVRQGTSVNFTVLRAGERLNIIPDQATATADMRYSDPSELSRVEASARALVAEHLVPDTEVNVTVDARRPPFARNAASDRLAELARSVYLGLGRSLEPVAMRYGTDAGFAFQAGRASPAVLEGLGIVGQGLHSPAEWANLESVVPRIYLSLELIEAISVGVDAAAPPR